MIFFEVINWIEELTSYVDNLYEAKYNEFLYYIWIQQSIVPRIVRKINSCSSCIFQNLQPIEASYILHISFKHWFSVGGLWGFFQINFFYKIVTKSFTFDMSRFNQLFGLLGCA